MHRVRILRMQVAGNKRQASGRQQAPRSMQGSIEAGRSKWNTEAGSSMWHEAHKTQHAGAQQAACSTQDCDRLSQQTAAHFFLPFDFGDFAVSFVSTVAGCYTRRGGPRLSVRAPAFLFHFARRPRGTFSFCQFFCAGMVLQ